MTKKLTDRLVESLKRKPPREGRLTHPDGGQEGLDLRVFAGGGSSWRIRYRVKHQGRSSETLAGETSLAQARQRARELIAAGGRGVDLLAEEDAELKRQIVAAETAEPNTVRAIAEEHLKRLERKGRAPSYIAATRRMLEAHVFPRWGGRDIRTVERHEITALVEGVADDGKPVLANRLLAAVRALFNFALARGVIFASPAVKLERPTDEQSRERNLEPAELLSVWRAFDTERYPFSPFFKVALATAQRRSEVAGMQWAEIRPIGVETGSTSTMTAVAWLWEIPRKWMKGRRTHAVPLSPLVMGILGNVPRLGPYVFSTDPEGRRPIAGHAAKAKARIDKVVAEDRELEPWTIHDLRRTAATRMRALGATRFIVERILAHADKGVTQVYDRYENLPEKREALERWGAFLERLTSDTTNVVELRRPGA
jgi:integrase